ncbi:MAG: glycoside hydrolase family 28 protein [Paludibacter sp.]
MYRQAIIKLFASLLLCGFWGIPNSTAQKNNPWKQAYKIIDEMKPPVFANKDFFITKYGAVGDAATNCTVAIKNAIEACHRAGGGRVVVPAGNYCTGPVYLKSNVNLHIEKGATLLFSTNPDDYLPMVFTRWEGIELMNYSPLIYAYRERNIAITGEGTLDGQASNKNWWPWKGRKDHGWKSGTPNQTDADKRPALFTMAEKGIPATERKFGNGYYLRPQFVQPYLCDNVLIEGVTILNSPMWILHPVLCKNLIISKVKIDDEGPNSDGCDPESCKNVWIKDCYFKTGDDCIAIKSGRNRDGRTIKVPCENVVVQNCTLVNGHAGIGVGSEISGGVKNIFFENCKIINTMWGVRIKTSSARGGDNSNIYIRNVEAEKISNQAVCITMMYEDKGDFMPTINNVLIENVKINAGGKEGIVIEGYPGFPAKNIYFSGVNITDVKTPMKISNAEGVVFRNTFINNQKVKNKSN